MYLSKEGLCLFKVSWWSPKNEWVYVPFFFFNVLIGHLCIYFGEVFIPILCLFYFIFLSFYLVRVTPTACGGSQDPNRSCSLWPTSQQCQTWAAPVTYTIAPGNARTLTHWARPWFKSTTSWFLVRFVSIAQQELPLRAFCSVSYRIFFLIKGVGRGFIDMQYPLT